MNIIFLCTGNTCRSPMAEGYLKSKIMPNINVLSRRISADRSPVSQNSAAVMEEIGVDISAHFSKQLTSSDIKMSDKIICLSPSHKAILQNVIGESEKLMLLGEGIADPFGMGIGVYRQTRDEIITAIDKLIENGVFSDYRVERAQQEHLEQIAQLEKVCFSEPWSIDVLNDSLLRGTTFFVCLKDQKVLGYIGINTVLDEGYITNVAVLPEWRKKGIASLILKELFRFAENNSLSFVSLEVRVSNQAAIKLYEKWGFAVEGKRPSFYRNPTEDAYIMTKRFEKNEDISD